MQITLNITEDSKVELVKDSCELVQGECCFTDFVFNFPQTIKGYAIGEFVKYIEFAECKELGECVKFVDDIDGNKYELNEACTAFKKLMVQIVLERNADGKKITWKTIPFTLEFAESINANGTTAIQAQLLSLTEIKDDWQKDLENTKSEWQEFINANCFRVVYSSANIPLANEESNGDTIFYLGDNNGDFEYGHYYRCVNIDGTCVWQDLTRDPSLEGVANGVREINKSRTIQFYAGTQDEITNNPPQSENTIIIPEDMDTVEELTEILDEMAGENDYIPINDEKNIPLATKYKKIPFIDATNNTYAIPYIGADGNLYIQEQVQIELGGVTQSTSQYTDIAINNQSTENILDGEKLYFNGEQGTYIRVGEIGTPAKIRVTPLGEWENNQFKTITALRAQKTIIPQKHLLFDGNAKITAYKDTTTEIALDKELAEGDLLEIHGYWDDTHFVAKVRLSAPHPFKTYLSSGDFETDAYRYALFTVVKEAFDTEDDTSGTPYKVVGGGEDFLPRNSNIVLLQRNKYDSWGVRDKNYLCFLIEEVGVTNVFINKIYKVVG